MEQLPDRLITADAQSDDAQERAMRPKRLVDYKGQEGVTEQMDLFIAAAKKRQDAWHALAHHRFALLR